MVNEYSQRKLPKVIRLTRYEFELDDGRVLPHLEPLEEDITLGEFQESYQNWYKYVMDIMDNIPNELKHYLTT